MNKTNKCYFIMLFSITIIVFGNCRTPVLRNYSGNWFKMPATDTISIDSLKNKYSGHFDSLRLKY